MKPIRALANVDDVVRLLAREGGLSPAEISEQLGIPRPSVYRLLDGLGAIGLTEPIQDSVTRLSLRWLHLADRARASVVEWRGVSEVLAEVVEETGLTAYFSVLRGDEAVCLEWKQGRGIGVLALRPGRSLPLHAGAAGRTLLAFVADLDDYLEKATPLSLTTRTLVTEPELREDIEVTRERGYVLSEGDVTDGIGALGVPVRARAGRQVAALSLAGLVDEVVERADRLAEAAFRAARRIEGFVGDTDPIEEAP